MIRLFLLFVFVFCFPLLARAEMHLRKIDFVSPALNGYDCHAPTIIEIANNRLLVAWFGGFGEGKCDYPGFQEKAGIWLSRYEDGRWSEPELIVTHEKTKCWNPVFHSLPNGETILFYKIGDHPRAWYGAFKCSYDEGKSWSKEEVLPAGILGPIKNKSTSTPDGTLICGSSVEAGDLTDPFRATACWIERASPDLKKWEKTGPLEIPNQRFGALQPSLYYGKDVNLHLLCRDRAHRIGERGFIWHALSSDHGQTWSELFNTGLPNPDSGIDTLKLDRNHLLLVYNPSHTQRTPLVIALSEDDGKSWKQCLSIDSDRAEYPYIISTQDGLIHLVYSHSAENENQRRIKHAVLSKN